MNGISDSWLLKLLRERTGIYCNEFHSERKLLGGTVILNLNSSFELDIPVLRILGCEAKELFAFLGERFTLRRGQRTERLND